MLSVHLEYLLLMHYFTSMRIQVKNDKTIHLIIYCFNYNLLDKNTTFEMGLGKQPWA